MSLQRQYTEYLRELEFDVRQGINDSLTSEKYGTLNSLNFHEDDQGVWLEASVQLRKIEAPWKFRRVVVRLDGPLDSPLMASTLFSTAMIEDLDTLPWPPTSA